MKVNQLIDKVKENWPAKVICFFLALFFYIFYQISILDSKTFSIPLAVTDSNGLVISSDIPENVKITLRGKDISLASLHSYDFKPYINLNFLTEEGTYKQPVLVTLSENALLIDPLEVKISPDFITVKVEQQITSSAKINVLQAGKPEYGYEVKEITVTPNEALVTGARSVIESYDRLQTQKINIEGANSSFSKTVGLINNSERVKLIENNPVRVDVSVGPILMTKNLVGLTVNYRNIPENFDIVKKVEKVDITLYGKLIDLEKYSNKSSIVFVDCSTVTEEGIFELPINYSIPHYIEFDKEPPQTVTVSFASKSVGESLNGESEG